MKILFKGLFVIICLLISLFIFNSQKLFINKKDISTRVIKEDIKWIDSDTDADKSTLSSNLTQYQSNSKKEIAKATICLFGNFDRLEDLMKASELVVKGTVIATEPYVPIDEGSHRRPYTKLTFKISKVISGEKRLNGKTISILEMGDENLKFEGILNSKVGQSNIAFLIDVNESTNLETKLYGIYGAYKGKFIEDNNSRKYFRGTPQNITKEIDETELRINNLLQN